MTIYDQIAHLASTAIIETHVAVSCSNCKGARFSLRTPTMYTAARAAISAGWCATDAGEILCPTCAKEQS